MQLKPPTMVTKLQLFLGDVGFYWRFIGHYADKVAHMTKLLGKQFDFVWDKNCHNAFLDLKKALNEVPILVTPNWERVFHVHVDASALAVGVVLCQLDDKGFDHPIYYAS